VPQPHRTPFLPLPPTFSSTHARVSRVCVCVCVSYACRVVCVCVCACVSCACRVVSCV
jgi:hypothetical protein